MPILRKNKLREKMRRGDPTIGTHIHNTWPGIMEVIGNTGAIDYVEFTSVYAPFSLYALDNLGRTSELYDMSTMIKIDAEPRSFLAQRAIGAGIQNVLFADARNVEDAEECVRAVRAEPKGWNGCAMHRIEGYLLECGSKRFVEYCDEVVVALMIEKKSAVDRLEDILNVDGVDMIQFGPCDYSMSIGLHGEWKHPKVLEAEKHVIKTSLKYDKHPRAEIDSVESAQKYIELGVRDFSIGTDVVILYNWLKTNGEELKKTLSKI